MFWNAQFLWEGDTSVSHIDVMLQMSTVRLADILYDEELLQEVKTSHSELLIFLTKPEIIAELVDNITQLTEQDCCDKLLYSRVHAAYISCEVLTAGSSPINDALINHPESISKIFNCLIGDDPVEKTRIVPQKATLVSKLINLIHSQAAANLSCYITQDIESFSKLIGVLINNIDISGSFEILSTFINRTRPPELRYVFCEVLSKLRFVHSLIDVVTLSDVDDKQRNASIILCDIIVIGRQDADEQTDSGPVTQDMLAELLESPEAIHIILDQIFSRETKNSTAIVCGMKVLQTLLEHKSTSDELNNLSNKTIERIQEEIEKYLDQFHELLLNPPKQEPIKTTFGIIQKPLGYMRLEVVNLIRALIGTNSKNIIKKLVELKTIKVIIDLFIDYSWNNLLHTQVEQALCLAIKNCRKDEDSSGPDVPSQALLSQLLNECDLISRLLLPGINGQANFGHIIQIINSIAINRDLDTIRDHLNEMKDKRPELFDRWTTFVNVDVASFKEISLYYDSHSAYKNVSESIRSESSIKLRGITDIDWEKRKVIVEENSLKQLPIENENDIQHFYTYILFKDEKILPHINVDVVPKPRRSKNS